MTWMLFDAWVPVGNEEGNYFGRCDRDTKGHCLPSGAAGAPRTESGPVAVQTERATIPPAPKVSGSRVGDPEHKHAEGNKNWLAAQLGGIREEHTTDIHPKTGKKLYQRDKKPYDVRVHLGHETDEHSHDIEVKSMLTRKGSTLSVHDDALLRKVRHSQMFPGRQMHTVLFDDRDVYAEGQHKGSHSGNRMYYKRGVGRYSLKDMHPVKDVEELKKLIDTPSKNLPRAARGRLPGKGELTELKEKAAKTKAKTDERNKKRKEKNKDKLREQDKARRERQKLAKAAELAVAQGSATQ